MATDLSRTNSAKIAGKHDAFVQTQLARAEKRVRLLDIGTALLGFAALGCVFLVLAALCDHTWALPPWARQVGLGAFVLVGGVYLLYTLARPLLFRVNPYYSAQLVEHTMPGAKNSVVNWLDLQQQPLPPAIRVAVGQKAAKDLSKLDIDRAFSARRVLWVGGVAALCAVILLICFVRVGSASFFRVVAPFSFSSAEATTRITLTQPANGDDTVSIDQAVFIAARIEGKQPDPETIRVLYRYQPGDDYKAWPMRLDGDEYKAIISKTAIGEGFWYKIAAGDTETPEYHINVRARPLLTKVQATYHFRPYLGWLDELHYANRTFKMEAWRGTEITLEVRTNRPVQDAALVLEAADGTKERIAATTVKDNPNAFQVKLLVEKSTRYHLEYTTLEGEKYNDSNPQEIEAKIDQPPQQVELTAPARDTQLPCNGILQVDGWATDDIGVKGMTLRMREVTQKYELKGKPYRSDAELRLRTGGYALKLAYKDYVDLNTVQTPDGKLFALQKGMVIEYWLEANDACDYPKANPAVESKHYRVTLLEPEKDGEKLNNQRDDAKRDQQKHEKQQNDALSKEAADRLEKQERDNHDRNTEAGNQPNPKEDPGEKNRNGQGGDKKDDVDKIAKELQKEIDKKKEEGRQGGKSKQGPDQGPAQAKDAGENKPPQPGESKPNASKPENGQDSGDNKPAPSDPKSAPGEDKPDGKSDPMQKPGENKAEASAKNGPPKSEGKEKSAPPPELRAEPKSAPTPQQQKDAGHDKPDANPNSQECPKADCKNGGITSNPDAKNAELKPAPVPQPSAAEGKNEGPGEHGKDPKAQQKPGADPASSSKAGPPPELDTGEAKKAPRASGSGDPRKATPEEVQEAGKDLQSADPQERADAIKKLEDIAKQAEDAKAKQAAQEELEDAGAKPPEPGRSKGPPKQGKPGQPAEKVGEKKDLQGDPKDAVKGKDGSGEQAQRSIPKDLGSPPLNKKPPELDGPEEKQQFEQRREEFLKKLKEDQQRKGEFSEQKWEEFLKQHKNELDAPDLTAPRDRNEPPEIKERQRRDQKASILQLREFLKAVDPKVLKEAGISEEQYREFLKNYTEKAIQDEQKKDKDTAPPPKAGTMQGTGSQRVNPAATTDPNGPTSGNKTQLPPGYSEAWKRLQRELNAPDDKK